MRWPDSRPTSADRSETTRWADASEKIRLLPVTLCGLLHGAYMETARKGSLPGADTRAAVSVPAWLTASSPPAASSSDFASIHSRQTRSESLAIAVRQRRDARALGFGQGAGSSSMRVATSGGGRLASWSNATS